MIRWNRMVIEEYIYESLEEKEQHKLIKERDGFEDSGQIKKDINQSFSNPKYKYYGKYVRYEK